MHLLRKNESNTGQSSKTSDSAFFSHSPASDQMRHIGKLGQHDDEVTPKDRHSCTDRAAQWDLCIWQGI